MALARDRQLRVRKDNPIVYLDIKIGERGAGRLTIELRADVVPKTAENFRRLCTGETKHPETGKRRHYAQCPVHRVIKDRFCQSGDYLNHDGSGGECVVDSGEDDNAPELVTTIEDRRVTFEDENFILRHTGPGVLSMVNTGPDSNASQFYLHFAPNAAFDNKHVVFGSLLGSESMGVLREIHAVATERGDPKQPVKISGSGQLYPV
ncbi:hypothetical protein Poli38472_013099 [Pythium oligandrum]|uniref:Peptidyl-prolyl cis-trans isomerase n=1 Tax=Pythium oligandrum TaxID=41045 RepID=A0A8K1C2K0_PYTOL|nr:hypothetical protein Poli38472_013099 [Pythium oligandrum]|eukprot:TMW55208.1 hypothetical protein Poli38472_013099 [Pythium oligandrum]